MPSENIETIEKHLGSGAAIRLKAFLAAPGRPEDTLTYNELKGFLFAIACAPEMVPPSEWLPLVFGDGEADYKDIDEANDILKSIMVLYNRFTIEVVEGRMRLPASCKPIGTPLSNLDEEAPLSQWSRGFLRGHSYLEEPWDEYTPAELDEELGSCLMILSFFADRKLAEAYHQETNSKGRTLAKMAESMLKLFENAMAGYAHLGRSIYQALLQERAGS